jgi:hypothetical protein
LRIDGWEEGARLGIEGGWTWGQEVDSSTRAVRGRAVSRKWWSRGTMR